MKQLGFNSKFLLTQKKNVVKEGLSFACKFSRFLPAFIVRLVN